MMHESVNLLKRLQCPTPLLKKYIRISIVWIIILLYIPMNVCLAGDCFIVNNSMAFNQPSLTMRACDLFFQSNREGKEKFVRLTLEKKVIYIRQGTQVFDCGIDLETMRDVNKARIQGIILPTFHCYGKVIKLVPIRVSGYHSCYWIDWDGVR